MKIGNIEILDNWCRSAGGWFKYSPDFPIKQPSAAISAYHPKLEEVLFPAAPANEIYSKNEAYDWTIEFHDEIHYLNNVHESIYGLKFFGNEQEVKFHIDNFLSRVAELVCFA